MLIKWHLLAVEIWVLRQKYIVTALITGESSQLLKSELDFLAPLWSVNCYARPWSCNQICASEASCAYIVPLKSLGLHTDGTQLMELPLQSRGFKTYNYFHFCRLKWGCTAHLCLECCRSSRYRSPLRSSVIYDASPSKLWNLSPLLQDPREARSPGSLEPWFMKKMYYPRVCGGKRYLSRHSFSLAHLQWSELLFVSSLEWQTPLPGGRVM